jgi:hypothetical protein
LTGCDCRVPCPGLCAASVRLASVPAVLTADPRALPGPARRAPAALRRRGWCLGWRRRWWPAELQEGAPIWAALHRADTRFGQQEWIPHNTRYVLLGFGWSPGLGATPLEALATSELAIRDAIAVRVEVIETLRDRSRVRWGSRGVRLRWPGWPSRAAAADPFFHGTCPLCGRGR